MTPAGLVLVCQAVYLASHYLAQPPPALTLCLQELQVAAKLVMAVNIEEESMAMVMSSLGLIG